MKNLKQKVATGIAGAGIGLGSLISLGGCGEILAAKMLLDDNYNTKANMNVNPQGTFENIYYLDGTAYFPLLNGAEVWVHYSNGSSEKGKIKLINGRSTWEERLFAEEVIVTLGISLLTKPPRKIPLKRENLGWFSLDYKGEERLSDVIQWGRE